MTDEPGSEGAEILRLRNALSEVAAAQPTRSDWGDVLARAGELEADPAVTRAVTRRRGPLLVVGAAAALVAVAATALLLGTPDRRLDVVAGSTSVVATACPAPPIHLFTLPGTFTRDQVAAEQVRAITGDASISAVAQPVSSDHFRERFGEQPGYEEAIGPDESPWTYLVAPDVPVAEDRIDQLEAIDGILGAGRASCDTLDQLAPIPIAPPTDAELAAPARWEALPGLTASLPGTALTLTGPPRNNSQLMIVDPAAQVREAELTHPRHPSSPTRRFDDEQLDLVNAERQTLPQEFVESRTAQLLSRETTASIQVAVFAASLYPDAVLAINQQYSNSCAVVQLRDGRGLQCLDGSGRTLSWQYSPTVAVIVAVDAKDDVAINDQSELLEELIADTAARLRISIS
jgi:hypothetical protein